MVMENHQNVNVTSLWAVQGPYDINSVISSSEGGENEYGRQRPFYAVQLAPPPSTDNEDQVPPCQLLLRCDSPLLRVSSMTVVSSARHIELYGDCDEYCCTAKGTRLVDADGIQHTDVLYTAVLTVDNMVSQCRLKFVSLTDKHLLTLAQLTVRTRRVAGATTTNTALGGRSIDMDKVRGIMASLPQTTPPKAERLMDSIEQYQKNQAVSRLSSSSSCDQGAAVTAGLAGILSALSKTTLHRPAPRDRSMGEVTAPSNQSAPRDSNIGEVTAPSNQSAPGDSNIGEVTAPSNQSAPRDSNIGEVTAPSNQSGLSSDRSNLDALSKLLTSIGLRNQAGGIESQTPDTLEALQMIGTRAADRSDRLQEPANNEEPSPRQPDKPTYNNGMVDIERKLLDHVVAMEERITERLSRQMSQLRDHIDLRLNKLEVVVLEARGKCKTEDSEPRNENTENSAK